MRRYLSDATREKLLDVGIFFSHFVPGYSSIRYARLVDETSLGYGRKINSKICFGFCDAASTALGVSAFILGAFPIGTVYVGTRAMMGCGEVGVRNLKRQQGRDRGSVVEQHELAEA